MFTLQILHFNLRIEFLENLSALKCIILAGSFLLILESVILSAVGIMMIALGDVLVSFKGILWVVGVWKVTQAGSAV